jgi:glycosyltransferase involved in cell wall biosynthesis
VRTLFYHTNSRSPAGERAFVAAARGLAERGHQVTFVCLADSPTEACVGAAGLETAVLKPGGSVPGDAWRLRHVLQDRFVEAVFVHEEREQLVVSSAMRLAERGGIMRRVPAGIAYQSGRAASLASRIASATLLFNSREELDAAVAGGLKGTAVVAPLGVNVDDYAEVKQAPASALRAPNGSRIIACVFDRSARGRIGPILRVMAALAPRRPELHLVVVGAGSEEEELRVHAAAVGVTPVVSFLGSRSDEREILAAADLVWVAAGCDVGAYGCLDAMALGIPVIAERDPLMRRYVADQITGILVRSEDVPGTAAQIAALLSRDDDRAAMAQAARSRVARVFPLPSMIDAFEQAASAAGDRAAWAAR